MATVSGGGIHGLQSTSDPVVTPSVHEQRADARLDAMESGGYWKNVKTCVPWGLRGVRDSTGFCARHVGYVVGTNQSAGATELSWTKWTLLLGGGASLACQAIAAAAGAIPKHQKVHRAAAWVGVIALIPAGLVMTANVCIFIAQYFTHDRTEAQSSPDRSQQPGDLEMMQIGSKGGRAAGASIEQEVGSGHVVLGSASGTEILAGVGDDDVHPF